MRFISIMHRILLAAILFHLSIGTAVACSCPRTPQPLVALATADAVFLGTVIERIDPTPTEAETRDFGRSVMYRFLVEQSWKGALSDTVDVGTSASGSSCGYRFELEKNYLVYATRREGRYRTSLCSRTRTLDKAGGDIQELNTVSATGEPAKVDSIVIGMMTGDLTASSPETRKSAALALQRIGKRADLVVRHLRQAYDEGNPPDRIQAIEALGFFDNVGEEGQALAMGAYEDEDSEVRVAAIRTIYRLKGSDEWKVPTLLRGMQDNDASVRSAAVGPRAFQPPADSDEISRLRVHLLADRDSLVRESAARSLYLAYRNYPSALPELMLATEDPAHKVRTAAVKALSNFDASTPGLIPVLIQRLSDPVEWVRVVTSSRIGSLKENPPVDLLIPPLSEAVHDTSAKVRSSAVSSLGWFLPDRRARDILMEVLQSGDESLQTDALTALTRREGDAEIAMEAIRAAMLQSNDRIRLRGVNAMGRFAADHAEVRGMLQAALGDPSTRVRSDAAIRISRVGPDAFDAIPALELLLNDPDKRVRRNARRALDAISGHK